MFKSKIFVSVAAFAVLALFGCDSSSSADSTPENNPAATSDPTGNNNRDSVYVSDQSYAAVDGPSASSNLISCEMQTADLFGNRFCVEADIAFADSVRKMCSADDEEYEGAVRSAVLGNGCPSGAVKICAARSKTSNDSALTYYYGSIFRSMSCEELVEDDGDEVVDVTPGGQTPSNYDPNGKTLACSFGPICTQAAAGEFDASECDGELMNACPAGGEKCDLSYMGIAAVGAAMYVYDGLTCDMLFQEAEMEF